MSFAFAPRAAVVIVCILSGIWLIRFCISVVYPALLSGIFTARGRVYMKEMHPIRFWLAVCFYVTATAGMITTTFFLIYMYAYKGI